MKDLPNSAVLPIARTVTGEACCMEVNRKTRYEYILNAVERSSYRRPALLYGSVHLFDLRPFLASLDTRKVRHRFFLLLLTYCWFTPHAKDRLAISIIIATLAPNGWPVRGLPGMDTAGAMEELR
jgi:hypothetical protein